MLQKIVSFWQSVTDLFVLYWKFLVVTWIQEVWRFASRCVTVLVAILLGFLNKPAFEEYWRAHRSGRIQKRESRDLLDADFDSPTGLGFESLIDADPDLHFESAPTSPTTRRRNRYKIEKDKNKNSVFEYEKVSTGLFEDIREWSLIAIDRISLRLQRRKDSVFECLKTLRLRKIIFSLCGLSFYIKMALWFFSFIWTGMATVWWTLKVAIQMPGGLRYARDIFEMNERARFDVRERRDILHRLGFPYQAFDVTTEDGYILQLERLPRPGSEKAVYFQHGVMDSAHAWLGGLQDGAESTAFRAYEMGYDVWAGTLRGCGWDRKHTNPQISNRDFWDFTVNEHAFKDIPAFIQFIEKTKNYELSTVPNNLKSSDSRLPNKVRESDPSSKSKKGRPYKLTVVAHSMGAMATLMYTVYWGMRKLDHGMNALILLSPAGLHTTAPAFCKLTGPFLSWFFSTFPNAIHSFHFPSEIGRLLVAKMVEDVKRNYSLRNFLSFLTYKFLGGEKAEHAITQVHNLTYNIFAGTSVGIFKHFWQNWCDQTFATFDYGPEKNTEVYDSPKPINILGNFDKINIPTFFVIGLRDSLIEPVSILKQYETLANVHPDLAHVRAFPRMGHIDLTLGENTLLTKYLINTMETINNNVEVPAVVVARHEPEIRKLS